MATAEQSVVSVAANSDGAAEAQRRRAHRELDLLLDHRLGAGYSGDITLILTIRCGGLNGIRTRLEETKR